MAKPGAQEGIEGIAPPYGTGFTGGVVHHHDACQWVETTDHQQVAFCLLDRGTG
jgi:hypothetical protein